MRKKRMKKPKFKLITKDVIEDLEEGEKKPKSKTNHVGVEIEFLSKYDTFEMIQYIIHYRLDKYVNIKDDGSIEGDGESHEMTIIAPERSIQGVISRVCDMLVECKAKVNSSCGMHVHIDMRNRNRAIVFHNLVRAQPVLYAMQPPSRLNNNYCSPTLSTDLNNVSYARTGINPCALSEHNTIEVRIHAGTTNKEKINNWIALLLRVVNRKDKFIDEMISFNQFLNEFDIRKPLADYISKRIESFSRDKDACFEKNKATNNNNF